MKVSKGAQLLKGIAAVTAGFFVISSMGTSIVSQYRSKIDYALGTSSYETLTDSDDARFKSDYSTAKDLMAAAKDLSIREGEEGTVVMKNDNNVLPISSKTSVALFGLAAYAPFPFATGDFKAGNSDAVDLVQAFKDAGYTVNSTLEKFYVEKLLNRHIEQKKNRWTGELEDVVSFDNIYVTEPGDMTQYQIVEIPPSIFKEKGADSNWESSIDKENTTGIVVFARGAGESNTYGPGTAVNFAGKATGKDPLALSEDELAVVDKAKETCSKVVVLINSGNTLQISDIAEGGKHEVDGIAYMGTINDYQCTGIVNVLTGKANATGALPDTYAVDNASMPAMQNFGGNYYADYKIVLDGGDDRYKGVNISNEMAGSFGGVDTYNGGSYYVEAEGIYIGYKYYETRYFDSIMNPDSKASSASGATQGKKWNYNDEVTYSFGHGLSYLDYTQKLKSINVDKNTDGNITAVIYVTNNSDKDGKFLAQLYVQKPYTEYDKKNGVEKSAVDFLNSGKVDVKAGETKEITLTLPSKYLASYDYKNAKTYILDDGDYLFTAAAGAHEAVNNFLAAQGKTVTDGMDAEAKGSTVTWNLGEFDKTTFAVSNNTMVTNVADDADLNYWTGKDTVTYLSRSNWESTWPKNYNKDVVVKLAESPKSKEWIKELKNQTYTLTDTGNAVEGKDAGLRFNSQNIKANELNDINNKFWSNLVAQITIDEAVGTVIHGGSQSDIITNVENPVVSQHEGVSGFTGTYTNEAKGGSYRFNIHSQTLLASSFNPQLAYEWGLIEGNSGLWLKNYELWGTGLTQRRTPYNGRNYEYISEDPMLTNRIGYGIERGCVEKGIINGPKHLGFNDQEHNRAGVSAYMTEQKYRETDLRCFEGALNDAKGMGVMIAFNRIGATAATSSTALNKKILRGEWGYTGLISTDMMNNKYYFNPESMIMAGITMVADFANEDNHINLGEGGVDAVWPYLNEKIVSKDSALVEQARDNLKYQLFTFANSAVLNISTRQISTWYDNLINGVKVGSGVVAVITFAGWIVLTAMSAKKKEEE